MTTVLLDFLTLFASGIILALVIWLYYQHRAETNRLHDLTVGLDNLVGQVDSATEKASRFLELTDRNHHEILKVFSQVEKNTYEQITKAEQQLNLHQAVLKEAQTHSDALQHLVELRTPRLQPIPTAPASYGEVDLSAPVTWAQVKAAGDAKRKQQAEAARAEEIRHAALRRESEHLADSQTPADFGPDQEYRDAHIDEQEPRNRFSAFDDVLRRAHKESNE